MSSSVECAIVEIEPTKWMLVLEDDFAPKNAWDWREYARAYGFFDSEDETVDFLLDYFSNPGGRVTYYYDEDCRNDDAVWKKLAAEAEKNRESTVNSVFVWRRRG